MQLHQPAFIEELIRLDALLLVVSFAPLKRFKEWKPYFEKEFLYANYRSRGLTPPASPFDRTRFVADPNLDVYHAYGLGRNTRWRVYGPRITWQYFRWGLMGKPLRMPTEDTLQRGGDFVVGSDERLTLCHVGRDQADRASAAEILAALSAGSLAY